MRSARPAKMVGILAFLVLFAFVSSPGARAGGEGRHYWVSRDPSVGYAVPIQHVFQFPAVLVFQPTARTGYAVPIQHVYQFPAALVFQPGFGVPFDSPGGASYDPFGGPSFIPR
jgi:hypothetical protein